MLQQLLAQAHEGWVCFVADAWAWSGWDCWSWRPCAWLLSRDGPSQWARSSGCEIHDVGAGIAVVVAGVGGEVFVGVMIFVCIVAIRVGLLPIRALSAHSCSRILICGLRIGVLI
jgi:hypothetical protein